MRYTVSDFLASHKGQVKLVAGSGGLARPIHDVGILDYEFMAGLKERYERDNFHSEQLVLSTFLYAKDDPYLIVEAIKRLVAKDASGLVFKNVLHLPLPEQAVRYANTRDFPLFVTTSDQAYFDCIVYEVASAAAAMEEAGFSRRAVDALLMATDPSERRRLALTLCPSFGESCSVVWVGCDGPLDPQALASIQRWWHKGPGGGPSSTVIPYDQGALLVATDQDSAPDPHRLLDYCASMPELPEELRVYVPFQPMSHIYRLFLYWEYQLGILPKGTTYQPARPGTAQEPPCFKMPARPAMRTWGYCERFSRWPKTRPWSSSSIKSWIRCATTTPSTAPLWPPPF